MKNILYAFLLFSSSFLLGSCSNDSDTTPPTIEIQKPEENEVVFTGSSLKMKFRFTDDYGIAYYKYEIFSEDMTDAIGEFTYKNEVFIPQIYTELVFDHSVKIDDTVEGKPTATGNYILRVTAKDIYGNTNVENKPFIIDTLIED